jgi:hypothetical protein
VTKREKAKFEKQMAARSVQIRAEHAALRAKILAARPGWDAAVLASIGQSYGFTADGLPGLRDLLATIEQHDALAARFGGAL